MLLDNRAMDAPATITTIRTSARKVRRSGVDDDWAKNRLRADEKGNAGEHLVILHDENGDEQIYLRRALRRGPDMVAPHWSGFLCRLGYVFYYGNPVDLDGIEGRIVTARVEALDQDDRRGEYLLNEIEMVETKTRWMCRSEYLGSLKR